MAEFNRLCKFRRGNIIYRLIIGTHHNQRFHLKEIVVTVIVDVKLLWLLLISNNSHSVITTTAVIIVHRWGAFYWHWWWLLNVLDLSWVLVEVEVYAVVIVVVVVNRLWACVLIECADFVHCVDILWVVFEIRLLYFVLSRQRCAHSIRWRCQLVPMALTRLHTGKLIHHPTLTYAIPPYHHILLLLWHYLLDLLHWWTDTELILWLQYVVTALWWW